MKRLILSASIAIIILSGCKARHVMITQTDSTAVSRTTVLNDSMIKHVDTTRTISKTLTMLSDSGETETVIIPKAGSIITVDKDGGFTGEISSITIKKRNGFYKTIDSSVTAVNGITFSGSYTSATIKVDSVHKAVKKKEVTSAPGTSYIWWIIGGIVLLLLVLWAYEKLRG